MNRTLGRVASILGVALVAGLTAPACSTSDESESIFIRGILAPPTVRTNGGCTYTSDPSQGMLFEGRLDVLVSRSYTGVMLVGNQLSARGDQNNSRAESNRVNIESVEVEVTDTSGKRIGAFQAPSSGLIDPQASNAPSYSPVGATLIDSKTTDALMDSIAALGTSRTVLANVRVKASTLAGTEVKSGAYQFPIRVCNGCLVDVSTGYDPATQTYNCNQQLTLGTEKIMPCKPGQDESTPCQFCIDRNACQP